MFVNRMPRYEPLSPEIHRTDFFQSPTRSKQLKAVLEEHDNVFYNQKMELGPVLN